LYVKSSFYANLVVLKLSKGERSNAKQILEIMFRIFTAAKF